MAARSLENQRFAVGEVSVSLGGRDRQPQHLALELRLVHLGPRCGRRSTEQQAGQVSAVLRIALGGGSKYSITYQSIERSR